MINLALIQHSFKGNKQATIDFTLEKIAESAKGGANLVALQELHTSEYFCQREEVEFFAYAESFEREKKIFANAAKKHKIVLVTSLFEKRAKGLYHNTAVVFEKDGSIAGQYRKMHIPDDPSFYEKFYFTPGDNDFKPIATSLGKIGVLICWDQWFPEAARLMAISGAEIIIYPTAIGWDLNDTQDEKQRQLEAWKAVQRGHAVANGVFVCAVNRWGIETCGGGNSVLGMQFRTCGNFQASTDSSLVESPKISTNTKATPQSLPLRFCETQNLGENSAQIAESALDSAESQNLNEQPTNSKIVDEFLGLCEASNADKTNGLSRKRAEALPKKSPQAEFGSASSSIHFWGNSFVFGPQGEPLALASESKDEILQVKIDLRRISQVRNIWPFLRDRRIEFYGDLTKRFID